MDEMNMRKEEKMAISHISMLLSYILSIYDVGLGCQTIVYSLGTAVCHKPKSPRAFGRTVCHDDSINDAPPLAEVVLQCFYFCAKVESTNEHLAVLLYGYEERWREEGERRRGRGRREEEEKRMRWVEGNVR